MTEGVTRRRAISGLAALAVVGFDPRSRTWITSASAAPNFSQVPVLDGSLFVDAAHLQAAGDDFGHLVHRIPAAVLLPGSLADVLKMVRYAREQGVKVAMRGQGHAQFGQCQVDAGLVIDSSSLDTIHSLTSDRARVDAGVRWSELVL